MHAVHCLVSWFAVLTCSVSFVTYTPDTSGCHFAMISLISLTRLISPACSGFYLYSTLVSLSGADKNVSLFERTESFWVNG